MENRLYALEFQCAAMDIPSISRRTEGFKDLGITPIWVLGGNRLKRKGKLNYRIKRFEWIAAKAKERWGCELVYFCPDSKRWNLLHQVSPYATNRSLASLKEFKLHDFSFENLLTPSPQRTPPIREWLTVKRHWRYENTNPYPSKSQRFHQQLLYFHRLSPAQFPIESGWPTPYYYLIETSPNIWQNFLLLECMRHQPLDKYFHEQLLFNRLHSLLSKNIWHFDPFMCLIAFLPRFALFFTLAYRNRFSKKKGRTANI